MRLETLMAGLLLVGVVTAAYLLATVIGVMILASLGLL